MNDSSLSIVFQIPQYVGIGLSEVFALTASYEYAYFCAPRSAASLFMSLRFCSLGFSSFLNAGLMYIFPKTTIELDFSVRNVFETISILTLDSTAYL